VEHGGGEKEGYRPSQWGRAHRKCVPTRGQTQTQRVGEEDIFFFSADQPSTSLCGDARRKGTKKDAQDGRGGYIVPTRPIQRGNQAGHGEVDQASLDINGVTARRAATGAQIFEVGGLDNKRKADVLAERMREVFADREEIRVSRPQRQN